MTRADLEYIASYRGWVQWPKSGRVERLRLRSYDNTVFALRLLTYREHVVRVHDHYLCVEVNPQDSFSVGQLLW